ncbi:MAG: acylphosphatase [Candidatus Saelkia tenebricola]|nr:acylphosphatase [Candidatus Saelkia tenebricola]
MFKRVHVYYSGRVQGVGFRFTVERIALDTNSLTGWVKNLTDDRVEVVAEGDEEKLNDFLRSISSGLMKRYIRREDIIWEEVVGDMDDFIIKFY